MLQMKAVVRISLQREPDEQRVLLKMRAKDMRIAWYVILRNVENIQEILQARQKTSRQALKGFPWSLAPAQNTNKKKICQKLSV